MVSKIKATIFIGLLITLVTFLWVFLRPSVNKPYYFSLLKDVVPIPVDTNIIEESKKCYIKILNDWKKGEQTAWLEIANLVKICARNIINHIPYLETTPLNPEHKYYMIPRLRYINDSCTVFTFGIGGDIDAEKHIQMSLPHCKFFGFDPNEKYETLFTGDLKGKFLQTAVGGKNEKSTIMQLNQNGKWQPSGDIQIRSAAELIETYHGKDKIVDILNIDIEGSEYGIFDQLYRDKIFKNVCQINVEFHPVWYHDKGYTFHQIIDIFEKIIEDGTFLWVRSVVHVSQFFPSYFVNIKNPYCIEKYLKDRLL